MVVRGPGTAGEDGWSVLPLRRHTLVSSCFLMQRGFLELVPMVVRHAPAGARGILSLMTVALILPGGKCFQSRGFLSWLF